MRRHSNMPSSHANAVFLRSRFLSRICRKYHARLMPVKTFAFSILERLSSILDRGKASFTVTSFSGASFRLYHDYPSSPRRVGELYQTKCWQDLHLLIGFRRVIVAFSPSSFAGGFAAGSALCAVSRCYIYLAQLCFP